MCRWWKSAHDLIWAISQVAVAIGLGMLFIVVNKTFEFLGDASVWIVITVGAQQM